MSKAQNAPLLSESGLQSLSASLCVTERFREAEKIPVTASVNVSVCEVTARGKKG